LRSGVSDAMSWQQAAAVLVATAAHGLVDVYWVRGTPLLGWLIVGMVCGLVSKGSSEVSA